VVHGRNQRKSRNKNRLPRSSTVYAKIPVSRYWDCQRTGIRT